jgi:predicted O-methyltransferase YrrM
MSVREETMLSLNVREPPSLEVLQEAAHRIGFTLGSDMLTGLLLRMLATTKPAGQFLELGTGTGFSAAWLLEGMDERAQLLTVDDTERHLAIARAYLGQDPRVTFQLIDGCACIAALYHERRRFDLIFADMWPGKFVWLEDTLQLLASGGFYVVDHLLPAPDWEPEHHQRVKTFIQTLEHHPLLQVATLEWSTGVLIAARRT